MCNQLKDVEIVIFDNAYVDFKHLFELMMRGILWVTRAKTNMAYKVVRKFKRMHKCIIRDAEIRLKGYKSCKDYPQTLRLIVADVVRDGKVARMEFITNNFDFSAVTICDL